MATGNVIIWDGNLGASKMADRVIEKFKVAAPVPVTPKTSAPDRTVEPTPVPARAEKSESEIRKLLGNARDENPKVSEPARKEVEGLDKSYLPLLKRLITKAKACDGVEAAQAYLSINNNNNRDIVPDLVKLTTGGNILSLFNLEQEFMCRRGAAYLLPFSAEGVRELTKLLDKGDEWERETAIFAFDDFTETYDYQDPAVVGAMKEAIPVMGKAVKTKHQVLVDMCDEVLGQIIRHSTPELQALAKQYYVD